TAMFCLAAAYLLAAQTGALTYPKARKSDAADDYHGVRVADPYRWLEDADAAETAQWVGAENRLFQGYLDGIAARPAIRKRLGGLYNFERYSGFTRAGNRYFYQHNSGLQNQSVIFTADQLQGVGRVLLDPNTLRADGTAAVRARVTTSDGALMAYAIAQA